MANVLVVAEIADGKLRNPSYEAFSTGVQIARETGGSASALLIGVGAAGLAEEARKYGISTALAVEGPNLDKYSPDVAAAAVAETVRLKSPKLVLAAATFTGKDIMARVAMMLDSGLAQDCVAYRNDGDRMVFTRPMYAGKVLADVWVDGAPALVTFRPKSFKAVESPVEVSIETLSLNLPAPKAVVEEIVYESGGTIDVTQADIIVSGGRGLKGPENWQLIENLASALGAATGCSRPVSDEGWRPHGEHVGQTGKTVSPNLYIAAGISGAIQHIAGISSSKYVVAINKDAEAPIFKVADYGIVGDLFDVLPAMTAEVKKLKG